MIKIMQTQSNLFKYVYWTFVVLIYLNVSSVEFLSWILVIIIHKNIIVCYS